MLLTGSIVVRRAHGLCSFANGDVLLELVEFFPLGVDDHEEGHVVLHEALVDVLVGFLILAQTLSEVPQL